MNGNCALCDNTRLALILNHVDCVKRLLPSEQNPGQLMEIAMKTSLRFTQMLAEMGVDINATHNGRTPIHGFVASKTMNFWNFEGCIAEFIAFCRLGADPFIPSSDGTTLFDMIPLEKREDIEAMCKNINIVETKEPDCM